ncbi:MAG: VOC family protein [Pseudomonadota bacterium]
MKPSYLEIGARDETKTKEFYARLFGWSFSPMEHGGVFETGGLRTGLHGGDPTPGIVVYFEVENIEDAINRVRNLGGKADNASPEEPGFGRFSACIGPDGIRFGLHQT